MANRYFLDKTGLSYFWGKIKAALQGKLDTTGTANKAEAIPYGVVDSTSTSTVFTATVPGITELKDGTTVMLRNGVVTSAANFTININGLGAKPAYTNLAAATRETTIFNVNYTLMFVYDSTRVEGGCWVNYRGYDANTNTIGYQLRTNSSTMPMKQITYRYRILFTSLDGQGWVPSTTSTSTNATAKRDVNQAVIDPFGEIVYYGTTASVAAGSNPSAAYLWQEYTLTLGYAFNRTGAALVLPYPRPIYIKAAPQTGGGAIIDADEPYVFQLPSTEDGKIYIYLGRTYSATAIEMTMNHPIYYFKGGEIREWTNAAASVAPVQSVNGQTGAVVLDASDVGALPDDTAIPSKTSDLTNDSGFLTAETDPTVPPWAKAASKPSYTAQEVGALPDSTVIPTAATANPLMDGTAAVGTSAKWAKEDHVHPTDTSRQATLVSGTNIKTVGGNSLLGSGDIPLTGGAPRNTWYGTSSTAAGTRDKVVTTATGDFTLTAGNVVRVKFAFYQNYNGTARLKVDDCAVTEVVGSVQYEWFTNDVVSFVYDGTSFRTIVPHASSNHFGSTILTTSYTDSSSSKAVSGYAFKGFFDSEFTVLRDDMRTVMTYQFDGLYIEPWGDFFGYLLEVPPYYTEQSPRFNRYRFTEWDEDEQIEIEVATGALIGWKYNEITDSYATFAVTKSNGSSVLMTFRPDPDDEYERVKLVSEQPIGGGGGAKVIRLYLSNSTLYVDKNYTTEVVEFYEYDHAAAWADLSSADVIQIYYRPDSSSNHIYTVSDLYYDPIEYEITFYYISKSAINHTGIVF